MVSEPKVSSVPGTLGLVLRDNRIVATIPDGADTGHHGAEDLGPVERSLWHPKNTGAPD